MGTDELLAKLADLHKQATEERSHFYVGSVIRECDQHIRVLAAMVETRDMEINNLRAAVKRLRPV